MVVHHIVNTLGWPDLRPLQQAAAGPVVGGGDALLLAPTAGGKTEAAIFPLLSSMAGQDSNGTSVLYLCPLKALLNNLQPRLERYAGWLGRQVAVWHGDVSASRRRAILVQRPDVLLTTPESVESMLVSTGVDHRLFFAGLRTVVVDEVHAFAGDDRGWHLVALLERLTRVAGRPLQRVGLSATVGNPAELLTWMQGSGVTSRPGRVVAPGLTPATVRPAPAGNIELDHVGSLANVATVIAALHRGEKRLAFCESRQTVEELGQLLRAKGLNVSLSHASLSADERRRAEQAFAEARDCVIVSTSTLELGVDVGDLDRVIQIDAPGTVASFLQRLGRTGRRTGTSRNCLFLTLSGEALTEAAALLLLWSKGWVEPVVAPPEPRHIVAQQMLALCLQENRIGDRQWIEEWNGLEPFGRSAEPVLHHLVEHGYLNRDEGMLFIGSTAETHFGRRHFMEMTAVFTGPPEFTVLLGRSELGRIDPSLLTDEVRGDRRLLLSGPSWRVTYVDWRRRRCFVEPADDGGRARWWGAGAAGLGFELTRAVRDVLLGADPPVRLTGRAVDRLAREREERLHLVHSGGNVIAREPDGDLHWWTFAGNRANATLAATLSAVVDPVNRYDDQAMKLRENLAPGQWRALASDARERLCLPGLDEKALTGLKFNAALPRRLALRTLAARLADLESAAAVFAEPTRFVFT
ncbi:ATP-dependent helicase Lhr and Lhr-like helicase [Micromonospora nigra]|uniref:ATP-dependent helicase Lhr and Lhr-like helicase n=1 Tax=Micromonospora nigra TaxID=145857 RepID=A0A1C6SF64_9ACTN|nr:DEAD/DEAH box helicase [Micromonospora nigra]SCL28112.1 ATP-dependent helicase Lhr and Lhr-like helicase [Micromonospora nigra]